MSSTRSLKGQFLIAVPSLRDPNFARSVVLICEHESSGALGLVLNRPSDIRVAEALSDIDGAEKIGGTLWHGGPVQSSNVFILHDFDDVDGRDVAGALRFGSDIDLLRRLLIADPAATRFRLFAGYAGWGAGQLEHELSEQSWIIHEADPKSALSMAGPRSWNDILQSKGGPYSLMALTPPDPTLN
mgnify:CR=1 FL=1